MTTLWRIPSNSGHDTFECELRTPIHAGILVEIRLRTRGPDRTIDQPGARRPIQDTDEHVVLLPQHLIGRSQLHGLARAFEAWPSTHTAIALPLHVEPDQKLTITVGPEPTLISSASKPVLRILYTGFALTCDWFTILDETCIRIASEQLRVALDELERPRA